ncbi:MAG: FAD-binding oxidoreductase [Bacteroidetes bacterium]|nr:FAD-binding oxidoreductase [Bacteroidota bacterium]
MGSIKKNNTVHKNEVTGWGNYPASTSAIFESSTVHQLREYVLTQKHLTARGNGKSYGDSSLGAPLLSCLGLNNIIDFDKTNRTITCESGVLLAQILELTVPAGYFLPVVPGTQFITIGGAVACDVHGKNHFAQGSFSKHVTEMKLLLASGETMVCSRTVEPDLFWATCGGMGLTGFIWQVTFRVVPIESVYLHVENIFCNSLSELFHAFRENNSAEHKVAWIDCLSKKNKNYKGILTLARPNTLVELSAKKKLNLLKVRMKKTFRVPFYLPSWFLQWRLVQIFNRIKWLVQLRAKDSASIPFSDFFFPLDTILDWNKLYGRKGFLQYQFVLPTLFAEEGTQLILDEVFASNDKCLLAVLKQFGDCDENALLSFPLKGFTVSLDFKRTDTLFALLDKLDEVVLKLGGRIYLAKDARMNLTAMEKGYPKLQEFQNVVKKFNPTKKFSSAQAERIGYIK